VLKDSRKGGLFLVVVIVMLDGRGTQALVVELDAEIAESESVVDTVFALDALCRDIARLHPVQEDGEWQTETLGDLLHEEVGFVACEVFAQLDSTTWRIGRMLQG